MSQSQMDANLLPAKFYKYRKFNENTLKLLGFNEAHYADPDNFNDPLDCSPTIHNDLDSERIERLWSNITNETNPLGGAGIKPLLDMHKQIIDETGYEFDDNGVGTSKYVERLYEEITQSFYKELGDKGVFSLATSWNCPLMWSHYADEHRGICIEFEPDDNECHALGRVNYNSSRYILLSEIYEWKVNRSEKAKDDLFKRYFFSKAKSWDYENEWRDISPKNGPQESPFPHISGVYFGLRCPEIVILTVMHLLVERHDLIDFNLIQEGGAGFDLDSLRLSPSDYPQFQVKKSPHADNPNSLNWGNFADDLPF